MQDDCIQLVLGLSELVILGQIALDDHLEVTVRYQRDKVACPGCGSMMLRKHESTFQHKKDRRLKDSCVKLKV